MKSMTSISLYFSVFLITHYAIPVHSMETTQSPRVTIPFTSTDQSIHDGSYEKLHTFLKTLRMSQQMRINSSHNANHSTAHNNELPAGHEALKQVTQKSNL